MLDAIECHARGDWGLVCSEDWQANEDALRDDLRLLSAYRTSNGAKFWIITEADRSSTTVLMPDDY
ncbi:MAG: type I restriction endonuclease subunit M [Pirellulales bacterium]|nr:type I restriction endonuclease subunit M [Pirellulales bacterium]